MQDTKIIAIFGGIFLVFMVIGFVIGRRKQGKRTKSKSSSKEYIK